MPHAAGRWASMPRRLSRLRPTPRQSRRPSAARGGPVRHPASPHPFQGRSRMARAFTNTTELRLPTHLAPARRARQRAANALARGRSRQTGSLWKKRMRIRLVDAFAGGGTIQPSSQKPPYSSRLERGERPPAIFAPAYRSDSARTAIVARAIPVVTRNPMDGFPTLPFAVSWRDLALLPEKIL